MIKGYIDLIEVCMLLYFTFKVVRFFTKKDKKHKKSIAGKVSFLFSRQIHTGLDTLIAKQKKHLAKESQDTQSNVVPFRERQQS